MVELRLKGKVALVTGASRGVGASVARMLASRGADIAINYHSKGSRAEDVATEVRAIGRRALLVQADLTNPDDVSAMEEAERMIQELAMRQRGVGEMSVDDVDE